MLRPEDIVGRDDAVLEDLLIVVDVVQEEVERRDALDQPLLDPPPLAVGNDPRHQIKGEDALGSLIVIVDREGDAASHEGQIDRRLLPTVLRLIKDLEPLGDPSVVRPHGRLVGEHFVKEVFGFVAVDEHGGGGGERERLKADL